MDVRSKFTTNVSKQIDNKDNVLDIAYEESPGFRYQIDSGYGEKLEPILEEELQDNTQTKIQTSEERYPLSEDEARQILDEINALTPSDHYEDDPDDCSRYRLDPEYGERLDPIFEEDINDNSESESEEIERPPATISPPAKFKEPFPINKLTEFKHVSDSEPSKHYLIRDYLTYLNQQRYIYGKNEYLKLLEPLEERKSNGSDPSKLKKNAQKERRKAHPRADASKKLLEELQSKGKKEENIELAALHYEIYQILILCLTNFYEKTHEEKNNNEKNEYYFLFKIILDKINIIKKQIDDPDPDFNLEAFFQEFDIKNTVFDVNKFLDETSIKKLYELKFLIDVIKAEKIKISNDDDDDNPLALVKKNESLLVYTLRVPFSVKKFLPEAKQENEGLENYIEDMEKIFIGFEILNGIYSGWRFWALYNKPDLPQKYTKLGHHAIKIGRLGLGLAVLFGGVSSIALPIAMAVGALYNLYKCSYILYNTQQKIEKTEECITSLKEKLKSNVATQKPFLQAELTYQTASLKKLKVAEYYQKRAFYRSIALVFAAGCSVGAMFCPVLGLVAFAIAVAATLQAREDLKERRAIKEIENHNIDLEEPITKTIKKGSLPALSFFAKPAQEIGKSMFWKAQTGRFGLP